MALKFTSSQNYLEASSTLCPIFSSSIWWDNRSIYFMRWVWVNSCQTFRIKRAPSLLPAVDSSCLTTVTWCRGRIRYLKLDGLRFLTCLIALGKLCLLAGIPEFETQEWYTIATSKSSGGWRGVLCVCKWPAVKAEGNLSFSYAQFVPTWIQVFHCVSC